ncbi:hypothetical protein IX332_000180 [Porphyromonas levii]|uniref:Uncharacterized protein n=2 Tax=Porphyromonas levii TaxID=28114 RepID=A0A4Y8WQW0_9PORP|nr:hypothetical protein [Porphyromonas levii]MBR8702794.1 hypothetical protein [Porphyromonas levii]MBR8712409.1 hypothetical protein [Porphyromonas levii]MBR8714420.1 hypothetical protein [Porphyromonas levii]MBR8726961.1 hypothetical protein [Porphyromonas levii]MBR8728877.1 hypothetical protein [Porphyromonas levii]
MAPSEVFWKGMKKGLLLLMVIGIVAAVVFFVFIPGNKGLFLGTGTLILVLNLGLMFIFTNANSKKHPGAKGKRESKAFDFRKDR